MVNSNDFKMIAFIFYEIIENNVFLELLVCICSHIDMPIVWDAK